MYQYQKPNLKQCKQGLIFLKVISQPVWYTSEKTQDKSLDGKILNHLSVGDITWTIQYKWLNKENAMEGAVHPEDNRFTANFDRRCFNPIDAPLEYHEYVLPEYRTIRKQPKKKLIL